MSKAQQLDVYLHYGDANHRPMQTVHFRGGKRELLKRIAEAKREKYPLRIQDGQGGDDESGYTSHTAESYRRLVLSPVKAWHFCESCDRHFRSYGIWRRHQRTVHGMTHL